jgi:hypothetical protein
MAGLGFKARGWLREVRGGAGETGARTPVGRLLVGALLAGAGSYRAHNLRQGRQRQAHAQADKQGKSLVKQAHSLKLTAKGIFTPTGQSSTSATKTFTLK